MTTTVEKIFQRAQELNIAIWVEGDKLICRGYGAIPPKMVEVIQAHKAELIAYLQPSNKGAEPTLCAACLDQNIETPARFVGTEDLMYCQRHYDALPSEARKSSVECAAGVYRKAFPDWEVTVEPRCTLAEHFKQLESQAQEQRKDYWTETRARLRQQGYYEQVTRDEEQFKQQVIQPRTYPAPFPAYAQATIDGVMTVQVVGMWHPTENRLMAEGEL